MVNKIRNHFEAFLSHQIIVIRGGKENSNGQPPFRRCTDLLKQRHTLHDVAKPLAIDKENAPAVADSKSAFAGSVSVFCCRWHEKELLLRRVQLRQDQFSLGPSDGRQDVRRACG